MIPARALWLPAEGRRNVKLGYILALVAVLALAVPTGIAAALAWIITIMRRAVNLVPKVAHAMINQIYAGTDTGRRNPAACYSGVLAGQPILIGKTTGSINPMRCVALDTAANVANTLPTFLFNGSFALTVTAKSSLSPSTNAVINPGDPIFADGGTLDSGSNMTYGFTLDANTSGVFFGRLDPSGPALTAGTTAVVTVIIDGGF